MLKMLHQEGVKVICVSVSTNTIASRAGLGKGRTYLSLRDHFKDPPRVL